MGEEGGGSGRLLGLEPGGDRGASFLRNKGRVSRRPFHTELPFPAYGGWDRTAETKDISGAWT